MSYPSASDVPQYPVACGVEPQLTDRNRVTTAFRIILGVPHIIIIGGISGVGIWLGGTRSAGALAAAAFAMAFISWFAVIFTGKQPRGLWDFANYYLRWLIRVGAYLALLRDDYPPFGDDQYPTTYDVGYPLEARNRLSVGLRFLYVIPHLFVLFFVNIGWLMTTVIAWFSILLTGSYPEGLYGFGVGALRWNMRVEAYLLLVRDEYPPFHLEP